MKKINVLSLFDGMSCGKIALDRANIDVGNYYSSEIDKYAIQVSKKNYPNIIQLGDVENWRDWDLGNIDMIIGGSPCQGFSFAGKQLAFDDPRSKLFFTMVDIINHYKPKYFLLENVKMKKEFQEIITEYLGVDPIEINSALVSAQNRKRLYWTNIPGIEQPKDKGILLKDILEDEVDERFYLSEIQMDKLRKYESNSRLSPLDGKSYCLNTMQGGHRQPKISYVPGSREFMATGGKENKSPTLTARDYKDPKIVATQVGQSKNFGNAWGSEKGYTIKSNTGYGCIKIGEENYVARKLIPLECERLQTVPDNYTEKGLKIVKDKCNIRKHLSFNKLKGINAAWNDAKEKQHDCECVIYIEEDLTSIETQIYSQNHNILKGNVNFVITRLVKVEQNECVQNIIKIGEDTETHYILTKLENIIEVKSPKIDTIEVIVEETDTGLLWKLTCEDVGINERLCIISTLIRQIIQKKIFTFVNQEASIHGYIDSLSLLQENLLGLELYISKIENIISISNTQRYKMLGNGWTVDVIAHIFSYIKQ